MATTKSMHINHKMVKLYGYRESTLTAEDTRIDCAWETFMERFYYVYLIWLLFDGTSPLADFLFISYYQLTIALSHGERVCVHIYTNTRFDTQNQNRY